MAASVVPASPPVDVVEIDVGAVPPSDGDAVVLEQLGSILCNILGPEIDGPYVKSFSYNFVKFVFGPFVVLLNPRIGLMIR
jgi:hypothetical protein